VNVISSTSNKECGNKVVFRGRVSLDDVSSLSSNIQVEYSLKRRDSSRSRSNVEHVRSVLEGSSELRGVEGKRNVKSILSDVGILGNRGVGTIVGPVNESRIGSVSVSSSNIVGRNVVSKSQYAIAVVGSNTFLLTLGGESPIETSLESVNAVTQMVVSGPYGWNTSGSSNTPGWNFDPFVTCGKARWLVILLGLHSHVSGIGAVES